MLLIIEPQALIRKSNSINVKNKERADDKKQQRKQQTNAKAKPVTRRH